MYQNENQGYSQSKTDTIFQVINFPIAYDGNYIKAIFVMNKLVYLR